MKLTQKERDLKELYKQQKSYDYWVKREQGLSYCFYPNNVYTDGKITQAHDYIQLLIKRLHIDEDEWFHNRKIVYLD